MSYYRSIKASKLHRHCESCYSRRCRAPVEIAVSCVIISCRALCGATFHLCKEEEHALLCPNEKVPCLNVHYGCPFTMCRSRLATHLEVCPASVVCCSVEWNRWPLEDIHNDFYINILNEDKDEGALDLSMALRDQRHLCTRIKMKSLFPELMDQEDEPPPPEEEGAVGGEPYSDGVEVNGGSNDHFGQNPTKATKNENIPEEKMAASSENSIDRDKYDRYEKMFSKERGGCRQAAVEKDDKKEKDGSSKGQRAGMVENSRGSNEGSESGHAPWQKGVLERVGQELTAQEYNMYIVHNGRMLISFGQMPACTPREKDFVYGKLEPVSLDSMTIPLGSYKPPVSYREKRRDRKDYSKVPETESKYTDTSDLDDIQKMDEMYATLLCCAEKEIRGHKICETVPIDGLFVDIATQTYSFPTAPYKHDTSLADITTDKKSKLYVQTVTESISARHDPTSCPFTFRCGHPFRRDEYPYHYKNVHADIQFSLDGWFEQRCPLAYLGCTHTRKNFHPFSQKAVVTYHQDLSTFSLKPEVCGSLTAVAQLGPQEMNEDSLSCLPYEVLCHIAGYLDSFTLSQLALVSQLFREICATHLQERGMVTLKWRKRSYSHGGSRWKCTKVWEFSHLFSKVNRWCFNDDPSMSDHLKTCNPVSSTDLAEHHR
ncbi:F-box only protein 40 isoform X2 [Clupea harengus]|uniref:F-box only protein 40 isoform X2 n=1 Tax=Clupea harengus TaxID=7950 RepID=A0A6P8FMA8_CLUHA|nr:F-box only protein 40 isoform X2 [Clupea harengus]